MKMYKKTMWLALVMSMAMTTANATTRNYFVDGGGTQGGTSDGNDGLSWTVSGGHGPFATIQKALESAWTAQQAGDVVNIYVKAWATPYTPTSTAFLDHLAENWTFTNVTLNIQGGFPSTNTGTINNNNSAANLTTISFTPLDGNTFISTANTDGNSHTVNMADLTVTGGSGGGNFFNDAGSGFFGTTPSTNTAYSFNNMTFSGIQKTHVFNFGLLASNCSVALTSCSFTGITSGGTGNAISLVNCNNVAPTLSTCTFSGNATGTYSGLIYISGSSASNIISITSDCVFKNNTTTGNGGVFYLDNNTGSFALNNIAAAIDNNSAASGGVAYYTSGYAGTTNITGTNLTRNHATSGNGGALCYASTFGSSSGLLTLTSTIDTSNTASGNGGVVYFGGPTSSLTVGGTGNIISNNTASVGGALYLGGTISGAVSISNATLGSNKATGLLANGGAIYGAADIGSLTLASTIDTSNTANGNGGMAYISGNVNGAVTINGGTNIISNNKASGGSGGAIYFGGTISGAVAINGTVNTISNNTAGLGSGGAIYFSNAINSSVQIANSTINNNTAGLGNGGAIYFGGTISGAVTINGTVNIISNNTAGLGSGGAIDFNAAVSGAVSISNATISNNKATGGSGGAINFANTSNGLSISGTTAFASNVATSGGGGAINFANQANGPIGITGAASFTGNTATTYGGAINLANSGNATFNSTLSITGATFTSNSVGSGGTGGGAIALGGSSTFLGQSSTTIGTTSFTGNTAPNGGAIWVNSGLGQFFGVATGTNPFTVTSTSFCSNAATAGDGGAIDNVRDSGTLRFDNCIFNSNTAVTTGGGIADIGGDNSGKNNSTTPITITNSSIYNNSVYNNTGLFGGSGLGGFLYMNSVGNLIFGILQHVFTNDVFYGNHSGGTGLGGSNGGALYYNASTLSNKTTINYCNFSRNYANPGSGGAIFVQEPFFVLPTNGNNPNSQGCFFDENYCSDVNVLGFSGGGAIYATGGLLGSGAGFINMAGFRNNAIGVTAITDNQIGGGSDISGGLNVFGQVFNSAIQQDPSNFFNYLTGQTSGSLLEGDALPAIVFPPEMAPTGCTAITLPPTLYSCYNPGLFPTILGTVKTLAITQTCKDGSNYVPFVDPLNPANKYMAINPGTYANDTATGYVFYGTTTRLATANLVRNGTVSATAVSPLMFTVRDSGTNNYPNGMTVRIYYTPSDTASAATAVNGVGIAGGTYSSAWFKYDYPSGSPTDTGATGVLKYQTPTTITNAVKLNVTPSSYGTESDVNGNIINYVEFSGITHYSTFGFVASMGSSQILPIDVYNFTGVKSNSGNVLSWNAANAVNFGHFELQRSTDSHSFVTIASIAPNAGGSYSYTDANAVGSYYYRLVEVDLDGSTKYSSTVYLAGPGIGFTIAGVYPNPVVDNTLNVSVYAPVSTNISYTVTDIAGRSMKAYTYTVNGAMVNQLDVSSLAKGTYIISIHANGAITTSKFTKL